MIWVPDLSQKNIMIIHDSRSKVSVELVSSLIDLLDEAKRYILIDYSNESAPIDNHLSSEEYEVDLVVIVAPVYNASYPGDLKNLLDFTPRYLLKNIPVTSIIHAGGPRFSMTWSTMYYPWLSTIGMNVLDDYIYLSGDDLETFRDFEKLSESPEFLSLVVDPLLRKVEEVVVSKR